LKRDFVTLKSVEPWKGSDFSRRRISHYVDGAISRWQRHASQADAILRGEPLGSP